MARCAPSSIQAGTSRDSQRGARRLPSTARRCSRDQPRSSERAWQDVALPHRWPLLGSHPGYCCPWRGAVKGADLIAAETAIRSPSTWRLAVSTSSSPTRNRARRRQSPPDPRIARARARTITPGLSRARRSAPSSPANGSRRRPAAWRLFPTKVGRPTTAAAIQRRLQNPTLQAAACAPVLVSVAIANSHALVSQPRPRRWNLGSRAARLRGCVGAGYTGRWGFGDRDHRGLRRRRARAPRRLLGLTSYPQRWPNLGCRWESAIDRELDRRHGPASHASHWVLRGNQSGPWAIARGERVTSPWS